MWYLLQEQYPIVQFNIPVSLSSLNAFYFCKHWHLRETFSKFPSFLVEMSFGVKSVSDDERGLDINVHISKHTSPKHTHRDLEMMCHNLSKNIGKYQIWGSICHILNIILSCFNLPFFIKNNTYFTFCAWHYNWRKNWLSSEKQLYPFLSGN